MYNDADHVLFQSIGEFVLTNPSIKMKPRGKAIYSVNEGNACLFDDSVTKYLESIKFPKVRFLVKMFLKSLLTVCCTNKRVPYFSTLGLVPPLLSPPL